jgi:NADH:ubiquinone oxidoreductase subunit K
MIALAVDPKVEPALELVREAPWAIDVVVCGAVAVAAAGFALTRRHPGEASVGFGVTGLAIALVLARAGQAALGLGAFWLSCTLGAAVAVAAHSARLAPDAPRTAPGNEQRLLALAVTGLLGGAWLVAALAVDWPAWNGVALSSLAVGAAVTAAGLAGVLTRRHWLSLVLSAELVAFGLVVMAVALPAKDAARFAALLLAWAWAAGVAGVALTHAALRRGHGPWVERPEGDERAADERAADERAAPVAASAPAASAPATGPAETAA